MEIKILNVRKWGNSGGILVPREWQGKQVKVVLVDRSDEIKKEVLEILKPYLEDLQGIYLVGSYARGEQKADSDIDVIAVSNSIKDKFSSGKYNVEIYTLEGIKKTLKKNPVMIYPRLTEAKVILNNILLDDLLNVKIDYSNIKDYIEDCKRVIKINKEFIYIDKEMGNNLDSSGVLYSLILRIRGIYFVSIMLSKKKYRNKQFLKWLEKGSGLSAEEVNKIYEIYREIRNEDKVKDIFSIEVGEKLLSFLEKEVKKYDKKKKAS